MTKSMRIALEDLELHEVLVVHAGTAAFQMAEQIRAVPLAHVVEEPPWPA